MRRDQLEHAIRTACQIANLTEVIIVGSQAILGSYPECELPGDATRSLEIDVLPIADDAGEIVRLADDTEGVAGEFSQYSITHGYSIDGVDLSTSILPEDWRGRLVRVQNANTAPLQVIRSTSGGASTRRACAWRSCTHCAKRTKTSSWR